MMTFAFALVLGAVAVVLLGFRVIRKQTERSNEEMRQAMKEREV